MERLQNSRGRGGTMNQRKKIKKNKIHSEKKRMKWFNQSSSGKGASKIADSFKKIGSAIQSTVQKATSTTKTAVSTVYSDVKGIAKDYSKAVQSVAQITGQTIQSVAQTTGQTIQGVAKTGGDTISSIGEKAVWPLVIVAGGLGALFLLKSPQGQIARALV